MRLPGQRLERIASGVLVIVTFTLQLACAQSGDSTAVAKAHYETAVAAIDKGDWQTAKNELVQAVKLAPSNALVHYDLALAYSHTGSPKSALASLNKALQLGLPPEQKQAAQQLKRQLDSSGAGLKPALSNNLKPEHSPEEIAGWIVSNSQVRWGNGSASPGQDVVLVYSFVQAPEPCSLSVHIERNDWRYNGPPPYHYFVQDVQVHVETVDPNKIEVVSEKFMIGKNEITLYSLALRTTNEAAVLQSSYTELTDNPYPKSEVEAAAALGFPRQVQATFVRFYMPNEDMANRMKKAFGDLVGQCGGKPSVGNIY